MHDNSRNGCEHGEADCMRSGVKKTSTTCTLHQQSEHTVFCLKYLGLTFIVKLEVQK